MLSNNDDDDSAGEITTDTIRLVTTIGLMHVYALRMVRLQMSISQDLPFDISNESFWKFGIAFFYEYHAILDAVQGESTEPVVLDFRINIFLRLRNWHILDMERRFELGLIGALPQMEISNENSMVRTIHHETAVTPCEQDQQPNYGATLTNKQKKQMIRRMTELTLFAGNTKRTGINPLQQISSSSDTMGTFQGQSISIVAHHVCPDNVIRKFMRVRHKIIRDRLWKRIDGMSKLAIERVPIFQVRADLSLIHI